MTSEDENEANQFARSFLIPPSNAPRLPVLRSAALVNAFAAELGIAPGIVVGRLQFDGKITYAMLNGLKVSYSWKSGKH
jgi:HTH-type transcriptional regulator/antitoxin HigA